MFEIQLFSRKIKIQNKLLSNHSTFSNNYFLSTGTTVFKTLSVLPLTTSSTSKSPPQQEQKIRFLATSGLTLTPGELI